MLENAKKAYIQEKNRFGTGYGEIAFIKGLGEMFGLLFIASSVADFDVPRYLYFVLPVVSIFGLWLIGYVWDKSHMNHVQAEYSNSRNYLSQELREYMKKKKP